MTQETKTALIQKFSSRKFWAAVAAFLVSIGMSIKGLTNPDPRIQAVGLVCGILGTAITSAMYSNSEAKVDAARLESGKDEGNRS